VLLGKGARALNERRGGMISLSYGNGRTVRVPRGLKRARSQPAQQCPPCQRLRRPRPLLDLPHPDHRRLQRVARNRRSAEAFVLGRVGTSDPSIRLACQLRPDRRPLVLPAFPPATRCRPIRLRPVPRGSARNAISSACRRHARFDETGGKRLPFDTVFIVNRFLGAVSQAVIDSGGRPNQFIGDGMLALFGAFLEPSGSLPSGLEGAALIAANIDELNRFLAHDRTSRSASASHSRRRGDRR